MQRLRSLPLNVPQLRAVVLLVLLHMATQSAGAQSVRPTVYEETGTFQSPSLRESSGVAVSRRQPGILWTHNDSGDNARIFATNLRGADLGEFAVRGAEAVDWEDIAVGPCPHIDEGESCLYIADTGDNEERRRRAAIYIVPEPNVPAGGGRSDERTDRARRLRIRYPDKPRDVEALAVTPAGDVILVSKGRGGPVIVYSIPADETDRDSVTVAILDTLPIDAGRNLGSMVTGAAVSTGGGRFVVRTYTQLHFFSRQPDGKWELDGPPCWLGTRQAQGEAVDFLDEESVVLTSEATPGRAGGIAVVSCAPTEHSAGHKGR